MNAIENSFVVSSVSEEPNIFDELREEIRQVIFAPEKRSEKTITIVMPDGKKVKQAKREDEDLAPMSLKLEGKGRKGDIYVRADGKRVRLVKRKEKRRKEKLMNQKIQEEARRLRNEAALRAQKEVEDRTLEDQKATKSNEFDSVASGETDSETEVEITSESESESEPQEEELQQFYAYLEKQEEQEGHKSELECMRQKSIEALATAERMRLLAELAEDLGNLAIERLRYVAMPRHPTQQPHRERKGNMC